MSAIIFVRNMFRPSIMASSTPPTAADRLAARQPPRAASTPPVAAPEMMEFQGSSFCLSATSVQSNEEKSPPQTAKFPADRRFRLSARQSLWSGLRVGARAQQAQSVLLCCARGRGAPPMTGALAFTAVTLPSSRSPRGEFLAPFTLFQTPPPMAPMAKAPPMSSKMRCGQGSRSCTDMPMPIALAAAPGTAWLGAIEGTHFALCPRCSADGSSPWS